jgi:1,4-alpha-glucan branching enzyme
MNVLKKKYFKSSDECEVTFEYEGEATEAALVHEGNNWQPVTMTKAKKGGPFRTKIRLPQGRYQFRYLLDGHNWANDEAADDYVYNEFGGKNSVVDTTASVN